jgi:signal peptidase II
MVVKSLNRGESIYVWSFFNVVRVENKGITFGLLNGALSPLLLIFVSLLVMILLCSWIMKDPSCQFPASLVMGGAIGNLVDRIIYGAVIDFLDFHLINYHWPAFNIADSAIVIGGAVLFFILYRKNG